jgi:hypothetical protein
MKHSTSVTVCHTPLFVQISYDHSGSKFMTPSYNSVLKSIALKSLSTTCHYHWKSTVSYLETRLPTPEEIDSLHRVELSLDIPWDPKADYFKDQEQACIDRRSRVSMCSTLQQPYPTHRYPLPRVSSISAFYRNPEAYIDDSGCDLTELRSSKDLAQRLISSVQIQPDDKEGNGLLTRSISAMHRSAPHSVITKEILVTRWCIGLESASRTLNVTT